MSNTIRTAAIKSIGADAISKKATRRSYWKCCKPDDRHARRVPIELNGTEVEFLVSSVVSWDWISSAYLKARLASSISNADLELAVLMSIIEPTKVIRINQSITDNVSTMSTNEVNTIVRKEMRHGTTDNTSTISTDEVKIRSRKAMRHGLYGSMDASFESVRLTIASSLATNSYEAAEDDMSKRRLVEDQRVDSSSSSTTSSLSSGVTLEGGVKITTRHFIMMAMNEDIIR